MSHQATISPQQKRNKVFLRNVCRMFAFGEIRKLGQFFATKRNTACNPPSPYPSGTVFLFSYRLFNVSIT